MNWKNTKTKKLFNAFLELKTTDEVANFCRDLMTESEIEEFASRWEAAQLLDQNIPQREIAKVTGTSLATVSRVNQWLVRGMNGYRLVLDRLNHHHP
jgi:TrpR-related protein YerC/YecD